MASTYLLNILIIVANKNRWVAANVQQFKYALNKLKKCNHGICSSKQNMGRTEKSIFQDAKPVSTFSPQIAEHLVAVKLLAFDRPFEWNSDGGCPLVLVTWVGAGLEIEPLGSARHFENPNFLVQNLQYVSPLIILKVLIFEVISNVSSTLKKKLQHMEIGTKHTCLRNWA